MEEGVEHCLAHHTCSISSSSCMPGCFRPPMVVFHGIVSFVLARELFLAGVSMTSYQCSSSNLLSPPPFFLLSSFLGRLGCYYVQLGLFLSFFPLLFSSVAQLCLFLYFKSAFKKNKNFLFFFLLQINIFFMFLDHFDALVSKIIFKK